MTDTRLSDVQTPATCPGSAGQGMLGAHSPPRWPQTRQGTFLLARLGDLGSAEAPVPFTDGDLELREVGSHSENRGARDPDWPDSEVCAPPTPMLALSVHLAHP